MKSLLDYQELLRVAFSERLSEQMLAKGHLSIQKKPDAQALANAIGISPQMARRYLTGKAIPNNQTIQKMADWLDTDALVLLYGKQQANIPPVHSDNGLEESLLLEIFKIFRPKFQSQLTKKEYLDLTKHLSSTYYNLTQTCLSKPAQAKVLKQISSIFDDY